MITRPYKEVDNHMRLQIIDKNAQGLYFVELSRLLWVSQENIRAIHRVCVTENRVARKTRIRNAEEILTPLRRAPRLSACHKEVEEIKGSQSKPNTMVLSSFDCLAKML